MSDTSQMLALFIFSFGLGAVIIVTLAVERLWAQIALTLLFSFSGASLFNSGDATHAIFAVPGGNQVSFAVIALATLAAARLIFSVKKRWRDKFRQILVPQLWNPQTTEPAPFEDLRKRWFVTVAGATGSVVGILMTEPDAIHTFLDAFSLSRLFFTVLFAVVSITLVGPGEEFIFGAGFQSSNRDGEHGQSHSHFEERLQNLSWRAAGRFALVLVPWLALNVMHKCMDESISSGQVKTSLEILLASVPAGMVTYYWCAALQRGVPAVTDASAGAVAVAAFLLFLPFTIFISLYAVGQGLSTYGSRIISDIGLVATAAVAVLFAVVALVLVFLFVALFGVAQYALTAGFGGTVLDIDKVKPQRAPFLTIVRLIGVVGFWQTLIFLSYMWVLQHLFGLTISDADFFPSLLFLLGTVGWGFGLLVSGFPKIVERARAQSPQLAARGHT